MATVVGWSKPSASGFEPTATSLKLGDDSAELKPLVLLESRLSPGLASTSTQSLPLSFVRETAQEFVASTCVTTMDLILSTLKKSLFSHCPGFGARLDNGSDTSE